LQQPDIKVSSAIHANNIHGFVSTTRPSEPKAKHILTIICGLFSS